MERIWPKKVIGMYISAANDIKIDQIISEFGFFHWFAARNGIDNGVTEEGFGDFIVKTKLHDSDEGGLCSGVAYLNSVRDTE